MLLDKAVSIRNGGEHQMLTASGSLTRALQRGFALASQAFAPSIPDRNVPGQIAAVGEWLRDRYNKACRAGGARLTPTERITGEALGCIFTSNTELIAFLQVAYDQLVQELPIILLADWTHMAKVPLQNMRLREDKELFLEPVSEMHDAHKVRERIDQLELNIAQKEEALANADLTDADERRIIQAEVNGARNESWDLRNALSNTLVW